MTPVETALAFFDAINKHDPGKLVELMTEDHLFVDSLGRSAQGRATMLAGWQAYFEFCPDYWVSRTDVLHAGDTVAMFGSAGGTISVNGELPPENKWQMPAAWRFAVHNGLIREFRVYADNKPVYDILAKSPKPDAT
jgi:ketosteroid isomerase-like protein